jgi:hypothetical protein
MSLANFQPRGKPQKEAENVATTPEVADEATDIMQSDEWSELKNNYGPILSPLPPTPPRVRPPEIHVPMRKHRPICRTRTANASGRTSQVLCIEFHRNGRKSCE